MLDSSSSPEQDGVVARPAGISSQVGCLVGLVGALVFVLGCFLPYYDIAILGPGQTSASLCRLLTSGPGTILEHLGGALYLFAGAATVGVIAFVGIQRVRPWTTPALTAATTVWALTWAGSLTNQARFGSLEIGFWVMVAGILFAVAGTVIVWVSRGADRGPSPGASEAGATERSRAGDRTGTLRASTAISRFEEGMAGWRTGRRRSRSTHLPTAARRSPTSTDPRSCWSAAARTGSRSGAAVPTWEHRSPGARSRSPDRCGRSGARCTAARSTCRTGR